jgi:hypothetical protein
MRRAALLAAAVIGLGFPAGLGLAVYMASGSSLAPPPASARVPAGTIAEPSLPPLATDTTTGEDVSGNCDEAEHRNDPECVGGTTTDETTETDDSSGKGKDEDKDKGKGRGRNRGHGGDD